MAHHRSENYKPKMASSAQTWNAVLPSSDIMLNTACDKSVVTSPLYDIPSSKGGISYSRTWFPPQATTVPLLRRSSVWTKPAETWVYDMPGSKDGISHCSTSVPPKATTLPSLREVLCEHSLQKLECTIFLHPKVEYAIGSKQGQTPNKHYFEIFFLLWECFRQNYFEGG